MKKKLLKSFLLAVTLLVGGNAWGAAGDKTTNVNVTFDGTATFTNSANWSYTKDASEVYKSASCWVWSNSSSTVGGAIENDEKQLRLSNGNFSVDLNGDAAGLKDIVTIEFDIAYGGSWSTSEYLNTFRIKDVDGTAIVTESYKTGTNQTTKIKSTTMGVTDDDIYVKGSATDWSKKMHFAFTFNYATKKISLTTTCSSATNTESNFEIDMPLGTKAIGSFYVENAKTYADRGLLFDNLVIKTEEGDYATIKTITYVYKDDSDNVITDFMTSHGAKSSDKGELNETYTPTYPSSVTTDDFEYDYTYASGGDAFTITGDKTITLIYNKSDHPTVDVKLKRMIGGNQYGELITVAEGYLEGKDIIYGFSKYIVDGGKLYKANAPYAVQTAASSTPIEITYTEQAVTGTPIFFGEIGGAPSNLDWKNYSGGTTYSNAEVELIPAGTLSDGFYTFEIVNNRNRTTDFMVGETKVGELAKGANSGAIVTSTFINVRVSGNPKISVKKNSTSVTDNIDYILAIKTAPLNVSTTVTSAGYATYVPSYDLNFTGKEIKAYKVKVSTKGVATLNEVANVPAGTPVLLYKDGGATENIPVMTGAAAVEENDLVAGPVETLATTDGDYKNMILNNVGGKIGFYFANGKTVAANRAYLHIASTLAPDASESRMVMVFADDEATAVFDLNDNSEMINNNWYDLQGRRVDGSRLNPGIYIVNGRKVVVK